MTINKAPQRGQRALWAQRAQLSPAATLYLWLDWVRSDPVGSQSVWHLAPNTSEEKLQWSVIISQPKRGPSLHTSLFKMIMPLQSPRLLLKIARGTDTFLLVNVTWRIFPALFLEVIRQDHVAALGLGETRSPSLGKKENATATVIPKCKLLRGLARVWRMTDRAYDPA